MVKYRLILVSLFMLMSCASRKTTANEASAELKIETKSEIKENTQLLQSNYILTGIYTDEFEITPIDTSKNIEVDGRKYKNVRLRHKKTKTVILDTTKINASKNSLIKALVKNESKEKLFKKEVNKKANYFIYLWLLTIPVAYYVIKKITFP